MKELSAYWNEARRHEAAGDMGAAKGAYESMLLLNPMLVAPQLRLSRFAQISDAYVQAHAHALAASKAAITTGAAKDVGYVSLRLLSFAEDGEVARLIRALDWSDAEVLKQAAVFAQHLWLVGQYDDALEFLTHVGTRVRPNHLLSYTRANVLRSLGRIDEATEHYEYALQLSPHDAYSHWSLAYHQAARPAGARIARIKAAQNHHPEGSVEQAHLFYALFKELDGTDQTEDAWNALQQGANLMKQMSRHSQEAEAQGFERLLGSEVLVANTPARVQEEVTPIFIVGMPRTGTTLLDRILGNHPDVMSAGERNDFDVAISEVSDHFYKGGLKESDWKKLDGMNLSAAGELYIRRLAPLAGGRAFFIDKNPQNFFNIGLILQALPQARILCLRRDPMDACFSNFKELFEGGAYSYSYEFEDLAAHQYGFTALLQHWQSCAPDSFHVVDYESLISGGSATLDRVLAFCGLDFVPGMLDITANENPVATASSSQVRQPIHGRNIGAWKRYASQLEPLRLMLENRMKPLLPASSPGISQ